jgi:hypothetical protein
LLDHSDVETVLGGEFEIARCFTRGDRGFDGSASFEGASGHFMALGSVFSGKGCGADDFDS